MYWFFKILLYLPVKILLPTKIVGKKNINKNEKTILICNHQSLLDVVLLLIAYPKKIYFLGKQELFNNKFKSWLFKSLGVIPINRENVQLDSIKQVLKLLKDNKTIGIFPEGTRNKNKDAEGVEKKEIAIYPVEQLPFGGLDVEKLYVESASYIFLLFITGTSNSG